MRSQHPAFWILTLCLVSILFLGFWILQPGSGTRRSGPDVPADDPMKLPKPRAAPPPPEPPPTARQLAPASVTSGHRLAGTVVGDAQYAVVEDPNGGSDLYHLGDMVSDLGELTRIEPERVLFKGANGLLELRLAPAPTETPAPVTPRRSRR